MLRISTNISHTRTYISCLGWKNINNEYRYLRVILELCVYLRPPSLHSQHNISCFHDMLHSTLVFYPHRSSYKITVSCLSLINHAMPPIALFSLQAPLHLHPPLIFWHACNYLLFAIRTCARWSFRRGGYRRRWTLSFEFVFS